jgi:hypothetical protein
MNNNEFLSQELYFDLQNFSFVFSRKNLSHIDNSTREQRNRNTSKQELFVNITKEFELNLDKV